MPERTRSHPTSPRKKAHVEIAVRRNVGFRQKTTGLERLDFVHNALPELNASEVDPSTTFLGRTLAWPFMVSSMTGGYPDALAINRSLAAVCEELRIALGVGSQRQALEDGRYHRTFSVVREAAPTIPIVGNIGAAEVARMQSADQARRLVDLIRADALAIHLNPLQELLQKEGTPDFRNVVTGIGLLARELPVPVIVKEIGAGISGAVARRLLEAGVRYIDVAGAGGTSWAGVEILRNRSNAPGEAFWDWGIPTLTALREVAALRAEVPDLTVIASGGITSGLEAAKCVALGAQLAGTARPVLTALRQGGVGGLRRLLVGWEREFRGAMFLTGSRTLAALREAPLVNLPQP